jgi:diadenosine tetraphosphatase ApaH/serine/threonine PP2A family protein phosphatase
MRALILSDIHANLEALDAVIAAAPAHDAVWNLGDIVGYGANPNEVIDRVRPLGKIFVRGNHDRACCGLTGTEDFNPIAGRAARWTQATLNEEHTAWLRDLAAGPILPNGPNVSCAHGSILDEDEYLLSVRDAWRPLRLAPTRINFFGHTHQQGGFACNDEEWFRLTPVYSTHDDAEEYELQLRSQARYLINPGSVGQPRDGDWRAAFALYDDEKATVSFIRVPYDVRTAQMRILRAGLPDRLATRLREGR